MLAPGAHNLALSSGMHPAISYTTRGVNCHPAATKLQEESYSFQRLGNIPRHREWK